MTIVVGNQTKNLTKVLKERHQFTTWWHTQDPSTFR